MSRRVIREEKSKTSGTKQVLTDLNTQAHAEEHSKASPGNPGGTTWVSSYKWGSDR